MEGFTNRLQVRMYDTDAAGILYFADQFRFVQDTFESFFESIGYPIPLIVEKGVYIPPVVHAECDYFKSLKAGMHINVTVCVEKLKTTAMTLAFEISADDIVYGRARMVYVFVSRRDGKKCPIPAEIKSALKRFLIDDTEDGRTDES